MVQLTIFQHWFRYWLGTVQATSHYLNQCWLDYRRIYTSLGLNELNIFMATTRMSELSYLFEFEVMSCMLSTFHVSSWIVANKSESSFSFLNSSLGYATRKLLSLSLDLLKILLCQVAFLGWGLGAFLRWWPPSAMWAGPLIFYGRHRGCLNNPIFLNLGLCAACWAHFMCHQELWPTSVSHPFPFLNSSLGLAGRKHYQKISLPIFRLVLQNFAIPGYFPYILFNCYLFSLTF